MWATECAPFAPQSNGACRIPEGRGEQDDAHSGLAVRRPRYESAHHNPPNPGDLLNLHFAATAPNRESMGANDQFHLCAYLASVRPCQFHYQRLPPEDRVLTCHHLQNVDLFMAPRPKGPRPRVHDNHLMATTHLILHSVPG